MIDAVLVKNANRMMTVASLLEDGIELGFADGAKGLIPYSDLPEIGERATLSTLELPNPYEMVLKTAQGGTIEIPWDFARHYCDASYRPAVEAIADAGKAYPWAARPAAAQLCRVVPGCAGRCSGHRAGDAGAAGEGGAHAEVRDPECSCQGVGGGRLGVVGGSGGSAPIVGARGPRGGATISGQVSDRVDCSGRVTAGRRGAKGVCVETGDVLDFAVRFVVRDGDVGGV